MLKITALKNITIVINLRVPQPGNADSGVPPVRSEIRRLTMQAGETRDDVVMVFGLDIHSAPAGSATASFHGTPFHAVGEVVPVAQVSDVSPISESFGLIRIELL